MESFFSPLFDNSIRATSAADCSAALRLKNPSKESYLAPPTTTVDLKEGSCEGPSLMVSYTGVGNPTFWAYSCSRLLNT